MRPSDPTLPPRWLAGRGPDPLANEARAMLRAQTPLLDRAARQDAWRAIVERASRDERRPAPRMRVAFALAAVTCVLLVLGVWLSRRPGADDDARMTVVRGSARVVGQPHDRTGSGTERLSLPARIEVRPAGEARVVLARGVRLRMAASTRARVRADGVDLESGEVRHRVAKGRGAWSTSLGRYRVIVVGTEYWTARRGTEAAVCVSEGRVRVIGPAGAAVATLGPGEAWRSSAEAPDLPSDLRCSAVGPARRQDPGMTDGSEVTGHGVTGAVVEGGHDDHEAPAAVLSTRTPASAAALDPDVPAPVSAPVQGVPGASTTADAPGDGATGLERGPAPPLALPEETPASDLALQTAAYSLGLSRRRAGDAAGALAAWLEYRRRWPGGALAPEADLGILETRLSTGSPEALAEATRFLRVHAGSERRGDVLAIRAQLLHRAGRWSEALADYDAALDGHVSARRRQEAAFGRAACLDALGRREAARAAYREVLERTPDGPFASRAREALAEPQP